MMHCTQTIARAPQCPILQIGAFLLLLSLRCSVPSTDGNNNDNTSGSAEPFFPANYREAFTEVRDCRNSNGHSATIRVYVNAIGVEAYLANANPLPVGTIVIKEEFDGTSCSDDAELVFWRAMMKESAGFDPDDGDWRWQMVSAPDRDVVLDTKASCIACHSSPDCVARDYMCTVP